MALTVSTTVPDDATRAAILQLADAVARDDGQPPLSDQTRTLLTSAEAAHAVAFDAQRIVGYAQLSASSLELAALPTAVDALLDAFDPAGVLVWTHGRRSRLIEALTARGYERARELLQLRRPLDAAHPLPADPPLAAGVTVRAFVPGSDDDAWLALNAAAFADHPEQGRWTPADLRARFSEAWFDPAGLLLAERHGALLGFHWTKVHPGSTDEPGPGEVYVLGVAPDAQGLGLGQGLLIRGVRHLAERGCPTVLLYVDGDNPALRLYERVGFSSYDLDVQWRTPLTTSM